MSLLAQLNEEQREAVLHEEGPVLVLAGAGSGKTRVITYRIAHLIGERNVAPGNIMAVTFTNKAAEEMKTRVAELVGGLDEKPVIATFHSFCLRILRRYIDRIGYPNAFSIYDTDDQVSLLKRILKDRGHDGESPRTIQSRISFAKNSKDGPENFFSREIDDYIREIYTAYQAALKKAGALDFDDILLLTNALMEQRPEIAEALRSKYRYVMVDEYQDTNHPQYLVIKKLAQPENNICAVGDDDQSIYRWRGADIANILNFNKDFVGTRVIKLERNYRSTQNILDAAHGMVENLIGRHPKKLWTDKGKGELVTYFRGDDENSEASFVVREINNMMHGRTANDFAILYRTNSQSRPFEEALARQRIPYQVVGGVRFYDRKEIKDVIAYAQFALNPDDVIAFRRIINNPSRGIGDVTIGKLEHYATREGMSVWEAIDGHTQFIDATAAAKRALRMFRELMLTIREHIEHDEPPAEVIDFILKESEYLGTLIKEGSEESMGRIDNIRELIASAKAFAAMTPGAGMADYLDQVSLVSDTDNFDPDAPKVTIMTLHSAKGLEFPIVFLAGLEDGLLPHSRNINEPDLLEEERRLCYVGMTRAREKLFLTAARSRRTYEGVNLSKPSRFLDDVPLAVLDERGSGRLTQKKRLTSVGANIDNIGKFFKDRKIDVDVDRLKKHEADRSDGEFRKGDEVFLKKYGPGRIMATEGAGDELRYIVYFPKIGQRKKLLARVAKLQRV